MGVTSLRTVGRDRAKHHLTWSPTQSLWFEHFAQGCIRRMGQDVRQDWALPLGALHELMSVLEEEYHQVKGTGNIEKRSLSASLGAFSLIAFCGSFRGPEVFMVDLHGLRKFFFEEEGQGRDHVVIPLLGRFKGEIHSRYHLAPLANRTDSGLEVRMWIERLIKVREEEGIFRGPTFGNRHGPFRGTRDYEGALIKQLQYVQSMCPGVIPVDVKLSETFGISRSFRREAISMARVRGVLIGK